MTRRRWQIGQFHIRAVGWFYLLVMVMIFAAAIVREINLLMLLAGILTGPMLYSIYAVATSFRGITLARVVAPRATAGELVEVEIELRNTRRRGTLATVDVEDLLVRENDHSNTDALQPRVWFARVGARQTARAAYRCRLRRRGRYRLGPLLLSTRYPFGLLERTKKIPIYDTLTVWPRMGRLTRAWTQTQHETYQASRRTAPRQGFLEGDFHGLRDWRHGDSRRWIHWRTTARRGALMVRQFEQQRNQDLVAILELWQPRPSTHQQRQNIELAISFVATVVAERCRRGGSRLTLAIAGRDEVLTAGSASMALHHEAMESLALAEPATGDVLPQLLPRVLADIRQGTSVLLVSTRPVDLTDTQRFVDLWDSPRLRRWAGRIVCIDVSSPQLSHYFVAE